MRCLTEAERAYRRGALQAIQFLRTDLIPLASNDIALWRMIGAYEQSLIQGRDSLEVGYLGTYMDEIRHRVELRLQENNNEQAH